MSEMVEVQTPPPWRLHEVVIEDGYLTPLRRPLPSRPLDPAVDWCETPRVWDLPVGLVVQHCDGRGHPRFVVTAEGGLRRVEHDEADVLVDPVLGPELVRRHAHDAACRAAHLKKSVYRHDVEQGHRFAPGFARWPSVHDGVRCPAYAVVTRVSARQVWARAATWEEALEAGAVT